MANLDSWESLQPLIKKLAALHSEKNVTPDQFTNLGEAIILTLEESIGDQFT